ncbi:hypothetical protein [Lentzea sp. NBRC 102530]|uniref:hypothetical protein n=1 Tax=Lentzea sp. NBRC 102530 TaxID=3032201 RepID=UPI0024A4CBC8|nr:hypothetical protein [Lentzea sp. NBRC 102530]GLY46774.1 hypothetical protein Lesp01_04300 [Lentzea sp. NBRC 102530]
MSVLKNPAKTIGETIGLGVAHLTGDEVAAAFSAVLGQEVTYEPLSHNEFRALRFREFLEAHRDDVVIG